MSKNAKKGQKMLKKCEKCSKLLKNAKILLKTHIHLLFCKVLECSV